MLSQSKQPAMMTLHHSHWGTVDTLIFNCRPSSLWLRLTNSSKLNHNRYWTSSPLPR